MKKANVAIVGATGMVGQAFIKVLEERKFPISSIYFYATKNSVGKEIEFCGKKYIVEELNEDSFNRPIDIALFSAGGKVSFEYAKLAKEKGIIVIDNSSAWRMDCNVPLVVPEVNSYALKNHQGIIANPNCSTIQCVVPLAVIHKHYRIKRISYTTYQAVSGSGYKGINDFYRGIEGKEPVFYPKPIYNNCIPQVDELLEDGYTKEEVKMVLETKKILNDDEIQITSTCVRVPVLNCHSVAINIECEKAFCLDELTMLLKAKEGLVVYDFPSYPTAIDVNNKDEIYIGRIRRDLSIKNGLHLWVVADNVRKGAATNAVQIAEALWKE